VSEAQQMVGALPDSLLDDMWQMRPRASRARPVTSLSCCAVPHPAPAPAPAAPHADAHLAAAPPACIDAYAMQAHAHPPSALPPPLPLVPAPAPAPAAATASLQADPLGSAPSPTDLPTLTLQVDQLYCHGCTAALETALASVPGTGPVVVRITEPSSAKGVAHIWAQVDEAAPNATLDVAALLAAARGTGKTAQVLEQQHVVSVSQGPLSWSEREELLYLRRRVQELESAIGGLSLLVSKGSE